MQLSPNGSLRDIAPTLLGVLGCPRRRNDGPGFARASTMTRTEPAQTKLVICVWHAFSLWNPPPEMPERIRSRWPEMRVVHFPQYDNTPTELPDTDIFVGFSFAPNNFLWHENSSGCTRLRQASAN